MTEITLRGTIDARGRPPLPADATAALQRLREGNHVYCHLLDEGSEHSVPPIVVQVAEGDRPVPQRPFAAVLGCADARVPVEFVFHQYSAELFVVRVAGNVPGSECVGSFEYAAANLSETLRLAVVLGHTGCGAVTAAVGSYLDHRNYPATATLRSIVDKILPAVGVADHALRERRGPAFERDPSYPDRLLDVATALNAALSAMTLRDTVGLPTVFGVFDLVTRRADLSEPPEDSDAYLALAASLAESRTT
jgi:carbonic anhydrase